MPSRVPCLVPPSALSVWRVLPFKVTLRRGCDNYTAVTRATLAPNTRSYKDPPVLRLASSHMTAGEEKKGRGKGWRATIEYCAPPGPVTDSTTATSVTGHTAEKG